MSRAADAELEQAIRNTVRCKNCGELIVEGDEPNVRVECPVCHKSCCTLCVEMTETETCCCVPE